MNFPFRTVRLTVSTPGTYWYTNKSLITQIKEKSARIILIDVL